MYRAHFGFSDGAASMMKFILLLAILLYLGGCAVEPKRLTYEAIQSPAMERQMDYAVYLPPGWSPQESLPLVLFLHGGGDDVECFDKWEIGPRLDSAMQSGELPRAVIVVPEGNLGFWTNWADGSRRYEDWVVDDLLPEVQSRFNTRPCPRHCHLVGISMGGYGALHFVMNREGLFDSAALLSAPVFDTEHMVSFSNSFWVRLVMPVERIFGPADDLERIAKEDIFLRWQEPDDLNGLRLFVARASNDRNGIIASNEAFHQHLNERSIPHDYQVFEGRHKWHSWAPVLDRAFMFSLSPQ